MNIQKIYTFRNELEQDISFINHNLKDVDIDFSNLLIKDLFLRWMETSPDSPWYNLSEEDQEAANILLMIEKKVTFDENLVSNEWCGEHTFFNDVSSIKKKVRSKHYNLRNI